MLTVSPMNVRRKKRLEEKVFSVLPFGVLKRETSSCIGTPNFDSASFMKLRSRKLPEEIALSVSCIDTPNLSIAS